MSFVFSRKRGENCRETHFTPHTMKHYIVKTAAAVKSHTFQIKPKGNINLTVMDAKIDVNTRNRVLNRLFLKKN